jgi:integrase
MNTVFISAFAKRLYGFLDQKHALGYSYTNIHDLRMFDRMCVEQFPNETNLTVDICNAWATRRGKETAKTTAGWSAFIREFARYLLRNGGQAYILPIGNIKQGQRYIPHIYSHIELTEMWRVFDGIQPTPAYPAAHLVLPTLVRLLYCCGMRPGEALNLRVGDVNLRSGKIFIAESKGNKDRIIMLADDVLDFCREFNEKIQGYFPNRKFFFAKNLADACDYRWVGWIFRKIRGKLHIESRGINPPRLYDLRHTFATHRLYQWMRDGKDLYVMMPYLSAYMGHAKLTETFYYVHLVPGMLEEMSGFRYGSVAGLFPEVMEADE